MAVHTIIIGGFDNDNVVFSIDYDDANMAVVLFRCVNNSDLPAWGKATELQRNRSYERVFEHGTITVTIPPGQANRLQLFINPNKNSIDGVEYSLMWPYEG